MLKTILIVDDVPNNINVLRGILTEAGYRVRAATNGLKALELANFAPLPDLILLDVMMPDMNGYEVCRRLKKDPVTSKIPVIFVTSLGENEDETKGFQFGAVDYIVKPICPSIVLARVAAHLSLVRMEELEELSRSAIRMLGEAGHFNDTDTGLHIWRMAAYSRMLATSYGWLEDQAVLLELAAPMHDTGKIGIPDSILKAPRKLTKDEWDIMKSHSQIGHDILVMSDNPVFQMAAEVALGHHEHWDGKGYPKRLSADNIPESARIVAIADVFDALTMKRPYKEAWPVNDALSEINETSGTHFDPQLVECFLDMTKPLCELKTEWDNREMDPQNAFILSKVNAF